MNESKTLESTLVDLTRVFNDGEPVAVEFADQPHAANDGSYVAVAPDMGEFLGVDVEGPNELRMITDTLSHEVEHIRESVLTGKKDFSARYSDEGYAGLAGYVINLVEDVYVDANRCRRHRGLRRSHAFFVDAIRQNASDVSELDTADAYSAGLIQVAKGGTAKGIGDADPEVREFLAWALRHFERARHESDPIVREAIAARIMDALVERLPEKPSADVLDFADAVISGDVPTDADVEHVDPADIPDDLLDDLELPDLPAPEDADDEADAAEGGECDAEAEADADAEAAEADAAPEVDDDADPADDGEPTEGDTAGEADDAGDDAAGETPAEADDGGDAEAGTESPGQSDTTGADGDEVDDPTEGDDADSDLDDACEEMDRRDSTDRSGDWFGVDDDTDYHTPGESDRRRYEGVMDSVEREHTPMAERTDDRDSRVAMYHPEYDAKTVLDHMEYTGFDTEVKRAFRQLKTRDIDLPAQSGDNLNIRNVVRHASGDYSERNLYTRRQQAAVGDRAVCVVTDMSGSMGGAAERDAKTAIAGLAMATDEVGDVFMANAFKFGRHRDAEVQLITGPDEAFDIEHLNSVVPDGYDPMALGIRDGHDLLNQTSGREKIMVVVCDGNPTVSLDGTYHGYGKSRVFDEVRATVDEVRGSGVRVLGLGIGDVETGPLATMFGEDGFIHVANTNDLADALVDMYRANLGITDAR